MKHYYRRSFNKELLITKWNPQKNTRQDILSERTKRFSANIPITMMEAISKLNFESKNKALITLINYCLDREMKPNETRFTGSFKVFCGEMISSDYIRFIDRKGKNEPMRLVLTKLITKEAIQDYIRFSKTPKL